MPAMTIPVSIRLRKPVPVPLPPEGLYEPELEIDPELIPERRDMPVTPRTLQ